MTLYQSRCDGSSKLTTPQFNTEIDLIHSTPLNGILSGTECFVVTSGVVADGHCVANQISGFKRVRWTDSISDRPRVIIDKYVRPT